MVFTFFPALTSGDSGRGCCCCSVSQSCLILCNPMDCSTPGFPVLHYLPEFAQAHVDWVNHGLQPSYSLSPPSLLPSIFPSIRIFTNESALCVRWPKCWSFQLQSSVLPMNTQDWSPLWWTVGSPCSPRDSQESSPTPQFKSISYSALSLLYGPTLTSIHDYWKNHSFDHTDLCQQSNISAF